MLLLLLACSPISVLDSSSDSEPSESTPPDSPIDTEPEVQGRLVVNELVSDNDGSHKADDGLVYDWIELTNVGEAAVPLLGLYATDDYDQPDLHPLPDLTLEPGDYLVLYGTGIPDATGQYMPFRLSSQGEAVGLFDSNGEAIDWVVFPALGTGSAYARMPDGGEFEILEVPTPGEANRRLTWVSAELISKDATWAYDDSGADLGTTWRDPAFDDAAWASGPAPLGYGDSHQQTVLGYGPDAGNKHPTSYLRHRFTLDAVPEGGRLFLELVVDDGAVVYLNGDELMRKNMPDGDITWATYANVTVAGEAETTYERFELSPDALREGENVLAAEVHQVGATSSDQTFGLSLELESLVEE